MEISQRQEDLGSSIISNTSLCGLAITLIMHIELNLVVESGKKSNFQSENSFKKSEKIKK
jgi:hypothetical protein